MTVLEIVLIVLLIISYFGFAFVIYTPSSKYERIKTSYLESLFIALFMHFITVYWYARIFVEFAIKPLFKKEKTL
jgi:hypothetical protein